MSIDATRSEGNTDKLNGYLDGLIDGQKRGIEIMKMKACREFSKILSEIYPEMVMTSDDIKAIAQVFRKRLEE